MGDASCDVCKFTEKFQQIFEQCAQHYLQKEEKEFYNVHRKNLLLQNQVMAMMLAFQQVFHREYQYKFPYQGQRCNPNKYGLQHGPWFFESVCNSKHFHLQIFNIFDKKNNYERFTYP